MSVALACPPHHTAYPSEQLARNAVTLHRWAFPRCPAYNTWPCGDHHHVGHPTYADGYRCKTNPTHLATLQRIRRGH